MPIVVRELVIRARVEESSASDNTGAPNASGNRAGIEAKMEEIVAICVEKVMETIERKKER